MKRRYLRVLLWVILTPIALFIVLMVLLYVPPVQNYLRRTATSIASESLGMDLTVDRIDLRFPLDLLVRGVTVALPADSTETGLPDTLLTLRSLDVRVQLLPLTRGEVELDELSLKEATLNSSNLIDGMLIRGSLGSFTLESHGVDLVKESVILNRIELSDTHLQVVMGEATEEEEPDTATTDINWRVFLHALKLSDVSVELSMPADSMTLQANIGETSIEDAEADIARMRYAWRRFQLSGSSVFMDTGSAAPASGLDPSHLALRDITIGIDSVLTDGRRLNAVIREMSMYERSGLSIVSTEGRLYADSTVIQVPYLQLSTPHSRLDFNAQTYWELVNMPTEGRLTARLNVEVGKQDLFLALGDSIPETFKEAFPFRPLTLRAGTEGNLRNMQISRFNVDLPGAFSLSGGGELWHLTDSVRRTVSMDFEMHTRDLNFLTALSGVVEEEPSIVIPDSMDLVARVAMDGPQVNAMLKLREDQGHVDFDAAYNLQTEAYSARLDIDSMQVDHFMPHDSIYTVAVSLNAEGQGTDFTSAASKANVDMKLNKLEYGHWDLHDVALQASLKSAVASLHLTSDNSLLQMSTDASLHLDRDYLDGGVDINVEQVDLYELGIAPEPLKRPFAFDIWADAKHDSVKLHVDAGDFSLRFRTGGTLKRLIERGQESAALLQTQIEDRYIDHAALRRLLPSAGMYVQAGTDNPISAFLATQHVSYDSLRVGFAFTPEIGINGRAHIDHLRYDSIEVDTVFFATRQDTTRLQLIAGAINAPGRPYPAMRAIITGEVRNEDAGLQVDFTDKDGNQGILFGLDARPFTERTGRGHGLLMKLTPENPVIAYRRFTFADRANYIYLHNNMRVYANVNMESDDGLIFSMRSNARDTISLQNMNIELSRFRLDELQDIIPYLPSLRGLLSVEANVMQTEESLTVAAEAGIHRLVYEGQEVGDLTVGGALLPGERGKQYVGAFFSVGDDEVLTLQGVMAPEGAQDTLNFQARLTDFPLHIANAFIPDRMAELSGKLNGSVDIGGTTAAPLLDGSIKPDSVSVFVRQLGSRYYFCQRPITVDNNRLVIDKFSMYTVSDNPFTVDGEVDFRNMDRPMANLTLSANDYTLLDAARTRESLVYGKVVVDVSAFVRGPLNSLTMRGSMSLLGTTDVTYVMTNSPLTVEDRMDGLVTFVSFTDTAEVDDQTVTLPGGMDAVLTLHIDEAVRLRADLSSDRSKYIELQGGGDLNMQYTRQGDLSLTGRYTLTGGTMKYSLPVIPLKEFEIANGSYVDWRGDVMTPSLNLTATETVRASVEDDEGATRTVSFNVSISIGGSLSSPELVFDLAAPEDATVQNELQSMDAEERSKQAIAMLATGIYLNSGSGLSMGSALNTVLQNQINALAGSALNSANASFSVGVDNNTSAETGATQTDYSFRYSQRFFNDRFQVVIGGTVSTGANASNSMESFIDNVSLEYRLDSSGIRYVRVFYDKNNESILDGEITETGAGIVLRRKVDRLSELFLFKKKN